MAEDEFSMTEQLSFMDMLQPWPHHLHIFAVHPDIFAVCDCGWVGEPQDTHRAAAQSYRDHIETPA